MKNDFKDASSFLSSLNIKLSLPPEQIYARLVPHLAWFQWLDGTHSKNKGLWRSIWVWNPIEICVPLEWNGSNNPSPVQVGTKWQGAIRRLQNPFPYIQERLRKVKKSPSSLYSGWYGLAGYELGVSLLDSPVSIHEKGSEKGDFWFGYFENVLVFDHSQEKYYLYSSNEAEKINVLSLLSTSIEPISEKEFRIDFCVVEDRQHYQKQVAHIKDEISRGNVYQVNYTTRFKGQTDATPERIFRALRKKSPVPYAALWNTGGSFVMSFSPELFLQGQGRSVLTRPIKGTVAKSENADENEKRKKELLSSEKDRAELLMIVDLVRNDLGHVCVPGSVKVPELFELESYSTVHHLVSTVEGVLAPGMDCVDAFCALFPAGSIVGAPKIAAAKLISDLEGEARRFYTGAVGYFLDSGDCLFNVAIRTFTLKEGIFTAYSGGGIVIDSEADAEYRELCAKVGYLFS